LHSTLLIYLFLLIIIYKLLIDVREVKTRFKLIKHIDTEKNQLQEGNSGSSSFAIIAAKLSASCAARQDAANCLAEDGL
jgi:hypothetical protein